MPVRLGAALPVAAYSFLPRIAPAAVRAARCSAPTFFQFSGLAGLFRWYCSHRRTASSSWPWIACE